MEFSRDINLFTVCNIIKEILFTSRFVLYIQLVTFSHQSTYLVNIFLMYSVFMSVKAVFGQECAVTSISFTSEIYGNNFS